MSLSLILGLFLPLLCLAFPQAATADRYISLDAGYVATSSDSYSSGLVYGGGITEGSKNLGFGFSGRSLANTISYEKSIKIDGSTEVFRFEETFSDFYLTVMGTLTFIDAGKTSRMIAGIGPQVHFLASSKSYIVEGFSQTARESRLGLGVLFRYQRVIRAFGKVCLIVSGEYSWMQPGSPMIDEYAPPAESMGLGTITAGLAFPF